MLIKTKKIVCQTKEIFNSWKLPTGPTDEDGDILWSAIVFIENTAEIWTHGKLFGGLFSNENANKIDLTVSGVTKSLSLDGHTQSYTTLTGSSNIKNQAILSSGVENQWILKTLGKNAFSNDDYLPIDGVAESAKRVVNDFIINIKSSPFITFNGSEAKTINFMEGDNISIITDDTGTVTISADAGEDTVNTAGATNLEDTKLFLVGAQTQTEAPPTYSNQRVYIGSDNALYSEGKKVSIIGHTHPYLPLSGGTMQGPITMPKNTYIYGGSNASGQSMLHFDGNRTVLGSIGELTTKAPYIRSKTSHITVGNGNTEYTVWDSGNDGKDSGLDADLLDGVHYQNILERRSSGASTLSAIGWYRIAKTIDRNAIGSAFTLYIYRGYNLGANESYIFNITLAYDNRVAITQVTGVFGVQMIKKIRVTGDNSGEQYVDIYMADDRGGNPYYWTIVGSATALTTSEANPATGANVFEFDVVGGCKSSSGFVGELNGNAATASKLATSTSLWGNTFDGTQSLGGDIKFNSLHAVLRVSDDIAFLYTNSSIKNTLLNAIGGDLVLGYRNTKSLQFFVSDAPSEDSGSTAGGWTTTGLGVGTLSPTEKLDVRGNIKASQNVIASNAIIYGTVNVTTIKSRGQDFTIKNSVDDLILYSNSTYGNILLNAIGGSLHLGYRNTKNILFYASDTPDNDGTGRVFLGGWNTTGLGIGISSPQAKLHVVGDSKFTGSISFSSSSRIYYNEAGNFAVGISPQNLIFAVDNSSIRPAAAKSGLLNIGTSTHKFKDLYLSGNTYIDGNIGIGTSAPTAKLHVAGDTLITGLATIQNGIITDYTGGQWLTLATRNNIIRTNENQGQNSAHGLFRVKSYNGDAVVFGGLGNSVGFYGFYKSTINNLENHYDWNTRWDTTNGKLYTSNDIYVNSNIVYHAGNFSSAFDGRYVKKAGDTMTGVLSIKSNIQNSFNINNKGGNGYSVVNFYVDDINKARHGYSPTFGSYIQNIVNGYYINIRDAQELNLYLNNKYKFWHNGNDGSDSGLDADLLDGVQGALYFKDKGDFRFNNWNEAIEMGNYRLYPTVYEKPNAPINSYNYGIMMVFKSDATVLQLYKPHSSKGEPQLRITWNGSEAQWTDWAKLALTSSTVAAAKKLATPVSLWGNQFDGTQNIEGNIIFSDIGNYDHKIQVGTTDFIKLTKYSPDNIESIYLNVNETRFAAGRFYYKYETGKYHELSGFSFPLVINGIGNNVGVGTYTPTEKLHVEGNIKSSGYITSLYASFTRTNNHGIQVATIRGTSIPNKQTGAYIHLYERVHIGYPNGWGGGNAPAKGLSTYGGAWFAMDGTSNVGIGTTLPTEKLLVNGNVKANSFLGTATISQYVKVQDKRNETILPTWTNTGVGAYFQTGSLMPSAAWHSVLQINGWGNDSYLTWELASGASSTLNGNLYYRNGIGTTWQAWKTIAFTTSNVASATKLATKRTIWGREFDGTANITGSLSSVANITMNGQLKIYASSSDTTHLLNLQSESTYNKILSNGSIPLSINPDGNNVAIGATTSNYKLGVNGTTAGTSLYATSGYVYCTKGWFLNDTAGTGLYNKALDARWNANGGVWNADKPIVTNGYYKSTVATGTAPIQVLSTTTCTNLNADLLDGLQGGYNGFYRCYYILNSTDYCKYVIPLIDLTNPASNTSKESTAIGKITIARTNALYSSTTIYFNIQRRYNSNAFNGSFFINGTSSHMKLCTFIYNGTKYAGVYYYPKNALAVVRVALDYCSLGKVLNIAYYNSLNGIVNSEIYNSILFTEGECNKTIYADIEGTITSASKLATARTINGTYFDGTKNITTANWGTARNIYIRDAYSANTGTAVSVNGSETVYLKLPSTIKASLSGNASTATRLLYRLNIWGLSTDGYEDISGNMSSVGNITMTGDAKLYNCTGIKDTRETYEAMEFSKGWSSGGYCKLRLTKSTGYSAAGKFPINVNLLSSVGSVQIDTHAAQSSRRAYLWIGYSESRATRAVATDVNFYASKVFAGSTLLTSDIRLKNRLSTYTGDLEEKLKNITPFYYTMKGEDNTLKLGFSANDIKFAFPELVEEQYNSENPYTKYYYTVDFATLGSLIAIQGYKDLSKKIKNENKRISILEDRLANLTKKYRKLKRLLLDNNIIS